MGCSTSASMRGRPARTAGTAMSTRSASCTSMYGRPARRLGTAMPTVRYASVQSSDPWLLVARMRMVPAPGALGAPVMRRVAGSKAMPSGRFPTTA